MKTQVTIHIGHLGVVEVYADDAVGTLTKDTPISQAVQELNSLSLTSVEIMGVFIVVTSTTPLQTARELGFKIRL